MIRKAELKDMDAINSLLHQVLDVHAEGRPDYFIAGQKKYSDEELKELILAGLNGDDDRREAGLPEAASNPIYVYENEEGKVVAHAFCIFETIGGNEHIRLRNNLYIDDLCVDNAHRKQGISTELYKYVHDIAKENNCDSITYNVWALNPDAEKHFAKWGFKPLKTTYEQML